MVATGAMAAVGAIATAWPFINNLNPAADTLALSTVESANVSAAGLRLLMKGQAVAIAPTAAIAPEATKRKSRRVGSP